MPTTMPWHILMCTRGGWQHQKSRGRNDNVHYQRAGHISERATSYHVVPIILNCHTTTLGTNDNYIRSS